MRHFSKRSGFRASMALCGTLALTAGCGKSGETDAMKQDTPVSQTPQQSSAPDPAANNAPVPRGPNDALIFHDKSAGSWLAPAAAAFNQTQGGGKIVLQPMGSREGRDDILYAKDQAHPALWIPGDRYWIDKLRDDSANPTVTGKSGASVVAGKDLLRTYVVLVVRADRAEILEAALRQPKYTGHTWKMLADAATGWTALNGPADWGKLKMAQSNPLKSNSGMLALALLYREFRRDSPTKNYDSPEFAAYMAQVEGTVGRFADTTSDALKQLTDGADRPDLAVAYESEALMALDKGMTGYRIVYPMPTIPVTVPVAVIEAGWVTDAQKKMGQDFSYYLQTDAVQEKAFDFGYRPVAASLAPQLKAYIGATKRQAAGFQPAPETKGSETPSKEKEGLIYAWSQWYAKASGAASGR